MNFGKTLESIEAYKPFRYTDNMIRLDANESCSDMPDEMKSKIAEEIKKTPFNRYPDAFSTELCKAFADFYGLDSKNVLAGNGSDELLALIFSVIVPYGSKILVLTPEFSVYGIYASLYGRKTVTLKKNEDLNFKADDVIECAKANNVDLIIFSNPCNPTGQGIVASEVEKIISSVDCAVCIDEAYMDFWSDNETVLPLIGKYDNLLVLKTCSKALGEAAVRVGFVVANERIISFFRTAKVPYNVSILSQIAATTALRNKDFLKTLTAQLISRKERLYDLLKALERPNFEVINTKTNFIVCRSTAAPQIYEYLKANNIIVRLIGGGILRITAGTRGENDILINKLEAALNETGLH